MKASELLDLWHGQTVVCIASGPSLHADDLESVRSLPSIVVNSSFRAAPWASMLYANDASWWTQNVGEVASFKGHKFCYSRASIQHGATPIQAESWVMPGCNGGATAIRIAIQAGAASVLLLGYDCKFDGGRKHWHADHPEAMTNCESIARWPAQFQRVADEAKAAGTHVINCSRDTALTCFERGRVEELLYPG